jgi:serine phosphatase RsbU (regulator of sigma subunit)
MTGDQAARASAAVVVARPEAAQRFTARRALAFTAPVVWTLAVLLWERHLPVGETHFVALLAATPALACAGTGHGAGIWLGGGCALLALYPLPDTAFENLGGRIGTGAAILCVAMASCYTMRRRAGLADELARTREIATAAQQALIRPLPPRIDGFTLAAAYLSAARGAAVGGDLYDVTATAHGVRAVIGDVRGHGLGAVSTVAAVLGGFREAVHDEPRLTQVLRRLERCLERHLTARRREGGGTGDADEEFVTLLLLELDPHGRVTMLNCGHPWPYRLFAGDDGTPHVEIVSVDEPQPPLGMFPLPLAGPQPLRLQLPPGDGLFLYTDGVEDARDRRGGDLPLPTALRGALTRPGIAATPAVPADVVGSVREALESHAGGWLPDDVALLALRNDHCRVHGQFRESVPEPVSVPQSCSCP